MEIQLTDPQRRFRDELRAYLAEWMTDALAREVSGGFEGGGPEFRAAMRRLGRDGYLGLSWPREHGG